MSQRLTDSAARVPLVARPPSDQGVPSASPRSDARRAAALQLNDLVPVNWT